MNTDRYKKVQLYRPAQRGGIDGFGIQTVNRQIQYNSRQPHAADLPTVAKIAPVTKQITPASRAAVIIQEQAAPLPQPKVPFIQTMTDQVPLSMPSYDTPNRPKLVIGRRKKIRRIVTRTTTSVLALIFIVGGFLTWRGYATAGKVLSGTTTVAALSGENVAPTLLKGEGDGRVNILLMGVGGPGHDGGDLTDTMILASVDPVNNSVALLSIPRDLWVKMPNNYYGNSQKINAAFSAGKYQYLGKADQQNSDPAAIQAGLNNVDTVVSQVLGTDVDYHVLVNFAAFAQAVDTVNGVSVDVKQPLIDASMAWENNNNATLVPAGNQEMDGKEALLYARSRHSTSDFDRSERQRQLIVALKQKVLSIGTFSNPVKLDGLASAFGKNVYSDLSTKAALRLYDIMRNVDDKNVQSLDLVTAPHSFVTTDTVGSSSVVRPKLGLDAYSDIQAYIRSQLRDGYLIRENAQIVVAGNTEKQAATAMTMLKDYGYNVTGTLVATSPASQTTVVDLSQGKAPYTRNYLEKRYGANITDKLPVGLVVPSGTQFVILVGE